MPSIGVDLGGTKILAVLVEDDLVARLALSTARVWCRRGRLAYVPPPVA